ncbi:hypothetical protein MRB53_009975 [Persea americana]|uniref:Uncharacterized protein n=1 Tax=Persea americana TaxID=3435 RepID=A0ACC2LQM0_PERAE|nr:hypothetical protein MRB53_009975 [Persea americana]
MNNVVNLVQFKDPLRHRMAKQSPKGGVDFLSFPIHALARMDYKMGRSKLMVAMFSNQTLVARLVGQIKKKALARRRRQRKKDQLKVT